MSSDEITVKTNDGKKVTLIPIKAYSVTIGADGKLEARELENVFGEVTQDNKEA